MYTHATGNDNRCMLPAAMRCVNIESYTVVLQGALWERDVSPCSRDAVGLLENNESIVTWLAPKNNNTGHASHIPVICYRGQYWTLSLRMSKCIYRHVRLRRGFNNVQTVHGIQTLRIPQLLLNEKQRTQARFEVPPPPCDRVLCIHTRGRYINTHAHAH